MAKGKSVYVCTGCGYESSKWNGKCPNCGEWNTFEETAPIVAAPSARSKSRAVRDISDNIVKIRSVNARAQEVRYKTGLGELDRVLGGGLVKGSIVLLGGEPGIGKSTLLLQICEYLGKQCSVLYVSGEESVKQIKLRAERLGVNSDDLYLVSENDAEAICDAVVKEEPDIVMIDSIQTMTIQSVASSAGSVTQVRECTNLFLHTAKSREVPFIIVGHVNKDGAIAGPKVLEHVVDAVLYFEGQRNFSYRILRAVKNRFGSTNEIGVFDMRSKGLAEVPNPSQLLLSGRPTDVSGCCVACVMEGSRPILAEVQALVTKSTFSAPRRTSDGFDYNRLYLIIAVLEKRLGFYLGGLDVYVNVVGGMTLDEPAADLSIALAIYSGLRDLVVDEKTIAFGEVGLGGELRAISYTEQRISEAERMGFERCILPAQSLRGINRADYSIKLIGAKNLRQAFDEIEK